jgi:heterotetrameric sarcosine oxidase delta subunit
MGLKLNCPNCGQRSYHEFWFAGELRPYDPSADANSDYANVWLRDNVDGQQVERWFHYAGCRRWTTLERDTRKNEIVQLLDATAVTPPGAAQRRRAPPAR